MSSHECRIVGSLTLNENVTEAELCAALAPFLHYAGTRFDSAAYADEIEYDLAARSLRLAIEYRSMGSGYKNEHVDALVESLSAVCDGPDEFFVRDDDASDPDLAAVPHFIGTPKNRLAARVHHGLEQLRTWIKPVVGEDATAAIEQQVLGLPRFDANKNEVERTGSRVGSSANAALFWQELMDSVESIDAIAQHHGSRTLADLMYLQNAVLKGGYIDHYAGESRVFEIVRSLPSASLWLSFIKLEQHATNDPSAG